MTATLPPRAVVIRCLVPGCEFESFSAADATVGDEASERLVAHVVREHTAREVAEILVGAWVRGGGAPVSIRRTSGEPTADDLFDRALEQVSAIRRGPTQKPRARPQVAPNEIPKFRRRGGEIAMPEVAFRAVIDAGGAMDRRALLDLLRARFPGASSFAKYAALDGLVARGLLVRRADDSLARP